MLLQTLTWNHETKELQLSSTFMPLFFISWESEIMSEKRISEIKEVFLFTFGLKACMYFCQVFHDNHVSNTYLKYTGWLSLAKPQNVMNTQNWLYLALWWFFPVPKDNLFNWMNYCSVNWDSGKTFSKYRTLRSISNASLHWIIIYWEMSEPSAWHNAPKLRHYSNPPNVCLSAETARFILIFHAKEVLWKVWEY